MSDGKGVCHICLRLETLTYEHVPPDRVQKIVDKRRHSVINPFGGDYVEYHKRSKRNLPPVRKFPRGTGRCSLCNHCQQWTQRHYGQAFYDWSVQMLRHGANMPA